jgi:hypothetical protein
MQTILYLATLFALILWWPVAATDVNVGVSINEDGIKGFYLAIGEHYKVAEKEVVVVRERNIPDEELPVVFYLARRAEVSPTAIIKFRLEGRSWMEITLHYGLTAEIFYVPVKRTAGPPYGKAYGHFKNRERTEWGAIRLNDSEILNFVNLKFISDHYGYSPDDVISMREKGKSFVAINSEVKKAKEKDKKAKKLSSAEETSQGQGKGKGKKK